MKALEAPSVARKAGSSGEIASLETSVRRLTTPNRVSRAPGGRAAVRTETAA